MNRKWFYRLLFSYSPVFFVMIAALLFIFYLDINQGSKRQLQATNEVIARQSLQTLDISLSSIEDSIIKELVNDPVLRMFYNHSSDQFTAYELYLLTEKLVELKRAMPLIDSVYFYNETRQEVLSMTGMIPIGKFHDGDFVRTMYTVGNTKWSNPRKLGRLPDGTAETYVVSLVKSAPVTSFKEGLAIVNVRVDAINAILSELSRSDYSYLHLLDSDGRSFTDYNENKLPKDTIMESGGILSTQMKSPYSKWYMDVGLKDNRLVGSFFMITNLWMYLGGAMIVIGLAWLSYVTHRNYKPISDIVDGIRKFSYGRSDKYNFGLIRDEFSLIQSAFDNLMLESSEMDKQLREDLKIKRKHELMEVLEGVKPYPSEAAWTAKLQELELPANLVRPTIVVADIDGYIDFVSHYSTHDQYLYKYMVGKALEEVCQSKNTLYWIEWIEINRMVVLLQNEEPNPDEELRTYELCEAIRTWVHEYLRLTISIGIGPQATALEDIPYCYQESVQALKYKATFGTNRTISYRETSLAPKNGIYDYLGRFRELAAHIRLGETKWQDDVNGLFRELAGERFTQDEISNLLFYFIYHLQKEMMELGDMFQHYWKEEMMPKLNLLADRAETVREAGEQLTVILTDLASGLSALRENRNSHRTIHRIKQYIEVHYDDPNLSLEQMSEYFSMTPRYISRLFKEEYGETFIVFVSGLRIKKAKQLLESTNESVQEIVEKVGYLSASAFIRIFRKATDMTPGEYRNAHMKKSRQQ